MVGRDGARGPVCLRLVRHGETDWNVEGRIQGHIDIPLNDRGREQAAEVAERLRDCGAGLVVTSDLRRAAETAAIIGGVLGLAVRAVPCLRERNLGTLQGKTAADVQPVGASAAPSGPGFVARMVNDPATRPEGSETLEEFRGRIASCIRGLVEDAPARDMVVVTHGGAVRAALLALTGSDHRDVVERIANCSVIRVLVEGGRGRIVDETAPPTDAAHAADEAASS